MNSPQKVANRPSNIQVLLVIVGVLVSCTIIYYAVIRTGVIARYQLHRETKHVRSDLVDSDEPAVLLSTSCDSGDTNIKYSFNYRNECKVHSSFVAYIAEGQLQELRNNLSDLKQSNWQEIRGPANANKKSIVEYLDAANSYRGQSKSVFYETVFERNGVWLSVYVYNLDGLEKAPVYERPAQNTDLNHNPPTKEGSVTVVASMNNIYFQHDLPIPIFVIK